MSNTESKTQIEQSTISSPELLRVKASEIGATSGESYSGAVKAFRDRMDAQYPVSFTILRGVDYDSKTDRYIAKFEATTGDRKFSFKCAADAALFLSKYAHEHGQ